MEKKNIAIVILAIGLIASGVGNIFLGIELGYIEVTAEPVKQQVIIGTYGGTVVDLDPQYAYDTASSGIIENICETLYTINWTDPDYNLVPVLATDFPTISPDGLEYTIPLRAGVFFHDGTAFNATTAKWTFDRFNFLINWSGNNYYPDGLQIGAITFPFNVSLDVSVVPTQTAVLYETADGRLLINRTEIIDPYTIRVVLNEKKGSFMALLNFYGMSMLSPTSTPAHRYYLNSEKLVGTGPFELAYILAGIEQKIFRFEGYWQGDAQLEEVVWSMFDDVNTANQAFLSGDCNVLLSPDRAFFSQIEADAGLELYFAGNSFTAVWITFNVDHIPVTMRKAIAYAYNYSYLIDVVYLGDAVRWPTYVPMGIQYANYSLNHPVFDRTAARGYLLADPVYGPMCTARGLDAGSSDAAWINIATTNPLARYNFSWNLGNTYREAFGTRLQFDAQYIGVQYTSIGIAWGDLLDALLVDRHLMDSYALGWAPDYLDPENYLNPIWSNKSDINGGNYNVNYDPLTSQTQILMDAALTESDPITRRNMYWEIQRLMVEQDYPGMPLLSYVNHDAWVTNFHGYVSNPASRVTWYGCYFT